MRLGEILGKTISYLLVAAALIVGGVLVLGGSHAYNDYLNGILGWGLIVFGVGTAGLGAFFVGSILYEERLERQDEIVHVTPRGAPPAPPPPWGMGDVGRPGAGVVHVGDGPLLILGLAAWTALTLIFFAPIH
jgi:hypothetical protein